MSNPQPRRGAITQPRATPWGRGARTDEPCKGEIAIRYGGKPLGLAMGPIPPLQGWTMGRIGFPGLCPGLCDDALSGLQRKTCEDE